MPKTKISEFSATPANNTDIDSINIAEGCAPSGINDAIRELMAQLKDFQTGAVGDSFNGPVGTTTAAAGAFTTLSSTGNTTLGDASGDAVTVNGTATFANANPTLTAGTANGVTYLNGSKVLTSGSDFIFDGTKVGIGTSSPNRLLSLYATQPVFQITNVACGNTQGTIQYQASGGTDFILDNQGSGSGGTIIFQQAGSERLKINAYGIGLGGATPSSGTGITFPATQSASSNANTLDDYEEGTWTPTVVGGYTGVTYSSQNGWYTKVGRSVVISGRVNFSGTSNTSGISVGGLPFSQGNLGGGAYGGGGIPYTTVTVVTNASPYCTGNTVEYYTMGTGGQIASLGSVSGVWLSFVISISTD